MKSFKDSDWLAGFTDGEGCFFIGRQDQRVRPSFSLTLRADDLPILDDLQKVFGGTLSLKVATESSNSKPAYRWNVHRKKDLAALVAYFDEHPLRAKKALDYRFWRAAVSIYLARDCYAPELEDLRLALRRIRQYDSNFIALTKPDLQLVIGDLRDVG